MGALKALRSGDTSNWDPFTLVRARMTGARRYLSEWLFRVVFLEIGK